MVMPWMYFSRNGLHNASGAGEVALGRRPASNVIDPRASLSSTRSAKFAPSYGLASGEVGLYPYSWLCKPREGESSTRQ